MRVLACALVVFCLAPVGCRSQQAAVASSARSVSTGSPLAPASGQLDAEIAMPPGFPSDFPIYPHARLTAGGSFGSSSQVAWGMEWETLDPTATVQAYYQKQLSQGDWTISVNSNATASAWAAVLGRKSDPHVQGTLAINADAVVNRILLSLVYPA
jgi:hypothetical protein